MGARSSNMGFQTNRVNENEDIEIETVITINERYKQESVESNKNDSNAQGFKYSIFSLIHLLYKKLNISNLYVRDNEQEDVFNEIDSRILILTWTVVKYDIHKVGVLMFMKYLDQLNKSFF